MLRFLPEPIERVVLIVVDLYNGDPVEFQLIGKAPVSFLFPQKVHKLAIHLLLALLEFREPIDKPLDGYLLLLLDLHKADFVALGDASVVILAPLCSPRFTWLICLPDSVTPITMAFTPLTTPRPPRPSTPKPTVH